MTVQAIELEELAKGGKGKKVLDKNMEIIKDVKVKISVVVGETEIKVKDLFDLKTDSVVKLDTDAAAPISIMLDGKCIGRGSLVVVDDNFGIKVTEILLK